LLSNLSRADQLLPTLLAENSVNVAVTLEVLHWRGVEVSEAGALYPQSVVYPQTGF
jgi:hypothetical protein